MASWHQRISIALPLSSFGPFSRSESVDQRLPITVHVVLHFQFCGLWYLLTCIVNNALQLLQRIITSTGKIFQILLHVPEPAVSFYCLFIDIRLCGCKFF